MYGIYRITYNLGYVYMIKVSGTCSPDRSEYHQKLNTCLTFPELVTLGSAYNMIVREEQNQMYKKINKSDFSSSRRLLNALNDRFSKVCPSKEEGKKGKEYQDQCWLEQPIIKLKAKDLYDTLQNRFRPLMPISWKTNKNHLLNTFDILKVLKQYEKKYDDFEFLGVYPLNFMEKDKQDTSMCVIGDICHLQIKRHITDGKEFKKRQFALVHNMDPHDQPGSHWVALYINIDSTDPRFGFGYYDSYGYDESYQVQKLYRTVVDQLRQSKMKIPPFIKNTKRHQYKNTECGMFSIVFVILCLENKVKIKDIFKKLDLENADDYVASLRTKLFRPVRTSSLFQ